MTSNRRAHQRVFPPLIDAGSCPPLNRSIVWTDSMSDASIVCERLADPDPRIVRMRVAASKGDFSGSVELWSSADAVRAAGSALKAFPSKVPDDCELYLAGGHQNLQINMKTTDHAGHLSLQVAFIYEDGQWWFRTAVEPEAVGRLGDLFTNLSDRPAYTFRWSSRERR